MTRVVRITSGILLLTLGLVSLLIASAGWSDFRFRGCADMPKAAWGVTANCADARFAYLFFGVTGGIALASSVLAWRWRAGK